jgi:antitoxin (DNA-binding transcriptional repressor) of toxin-antitoxin stability system
MIKVNTHEAKTKLSALLAAVEETGEVVLICRNGKPVAELRALGTSVNPLRTHPVLSLVEFLGEPTEPLDPEDWPGSDLEQRDEAASGEHGDPADRFGSDA